MATLNSTVSTRFEPDALELEIFRYAIESVVDELDINLTRTAFSPIIYEYKDYCVGFLTRDFRMLGQSPNSLPIFMADLGNPVRDAVGIIGEASLENGDVLLSNYGEVCGQHLNNVVAATPVFDERGIAGFVAARTHWIDVGGAVPMSMGWNCESILQEGFQMRGVRIVRRGEVVPELLATIQANTYMPDQVTGDLMAQIAACKLGVRRWQERVGSRWTSGQVDDLVNAQFRASERLARQRISELPDGAYSASCSLDDSGAPGSPPLPLRVDIMVDGDSMIVDLSHLPPQVKAPINSGAEGGAVSAMRCAFKAVLVPDTPPDEGLFAPLEIRIPPGTVMSAVDNAPMAHWNTTIPTMVDLFVRAIGERLPQKVPAGHHGTVSAVTLRGRRPDGGWWSYIDTGNGGFGASAESDGFGPLKTIVHGDNPTIPVELAEARSPLRFHEYRLRREAGGRGLHRGGPGTVKTIEVLRAGTVDLSFDRTLDPPWGMAGGEPGLTSGALVRHAGDAEWTSYTKISNVPVAPGTIIRIQTGGGGGWGKPATPAEQ